VLRYWDVCVRSSYCENRDVILAMLNLIWGYCKSPVIGIWMIFTFNVGVFEKCFEGC
jgi:hypothetical protein